MIARLSDVGLPLLFVAALQYFKLSSSTMRIFRHSCLRALTGRGRCLVLLALTVRWGVVLQRHLLLFIGRFGGNGCLNFILVCPRGEGLCLARADFACWLAVPVLYCRPSPRKICNGAEKPLQTFPIAELPHIISTVIGFIFAYSYYLSWFYGKTEYITEYKNFIINCQIFEQTIFTLYNTQKVFFNTFENENQEHYKNGGRSAMKGGKICNVSNLPAWGKICNVTDLPGKGLQCCKSSGGKVCNVEDLPGGRSTRGKVCNKTPGCIAGELGSVMDL